MPPPDLVAFGVLHRAMRVDSCRFAQAIGEITEADRSERSHRLARWYQGFQPEVHDHHTVEDESFLAALHLRVPLVGHHIGHIETDHARLDAALDRTERALVRLGDRSLAFSTASRRAIQSATDLHQLLDDHLDFEEEFMLPLLEREARTADYVPVDRRFSRQSWFGQLSFSIPWVMDHAQPEEREALLGAAPLTVKWLLRATRRRYRRLVTEAFGPSPP